MRRWGIPEQEGQNSRKPVLHAAKFVKAPVFWKSLLHKPFVSSLIFDKCKSAENILETLGFIWLVMAKEALFTSYSVPSVAALPASCLPQPSREECFILTGLLPHWQL